MLAFSIAPDACNGIEYYTFLRRAYTKGIPLLSNTKFNIIKYFQKKKKKKKKTISFSGYGFMEPDLLVWSCKIDFMQIAHWAFGIGVPGLIIDEERRGKDRSTKDPTPLRKANESFFLFFILF